jgi:hypothetical protein
LYPAPFREVFAREMAEVFEEVQADRRTRGIFEYFVFLFSEIAGTIGGAFRMWSEGLIERSRRKLVISYWISIVAGVSITAFFQWFFYAHVGNASILASPDHDVPSTVPVAFVPLLLAGGVLILLSVFSIAFVWNMRMIGNRAGRLKPIWMPAGDSRSRKNVARLKSAVPIYNLDRLE